MMGAPIVSPEERKRIDEAVAARKATVAASLGKSVEELDRSHHAHHDHHDHGESEGDGHDHCHGEHAHCCDNDPTDETAGNSPEVDEEAVLAFIRTRQETIERQRAKIKSLEARVRHVESQRDLAEKKNTALRDALAKMREEIKELKSAQQ